MNRIFQTLVTFTTKRFVIFLIFCLLLVTTARGDDLFQISALPQGSTIPVTGGGNSLLDLTQQLINNAGQFAALSGHNYNAVLNYGGVANALNFNVNQGGIYTAHLSSPIVPSISRQFVSTVSQSDLYNQIQNYLKTDGSSDLAKLIAAINQQSAAGTVDGNPHAATAHNAQAAFFDYAFAPTQTEEETDSAASGDGRDKDSKVGFAVTAQGGPFESRGIKGESYSLTPKVPLKLSDRVRLEISLPLEYTRIQDATEYGVGLQLALPVLIVKHTKQQPWTWQVTPVVGSLVSASQDLLAGGLLVNGTLASYSAYHWKKWEFSMGNAISLYEGVRVSIGSYSYDPNVSQQIFKNGLKVGRQLGHRWYVELYAIDTEFLQTAFTPRYYTFGGGVGYRSASKKGYMMLGAYTDQDPGKYSAAQFQFGTGWKF